jgi:hypothetical protein
LLLILRLQTDNPTRLILVTVTIVSVQPRTVPGPAPTPPLIGRSSCPTNLRKIQIHNHINNLWQRLRNYGFHLGFVGISIHAILFPLNYAHLRETRHGNLDMTILLCAIPEYSQNKTKNGFKPVEIYRKSFQDKFHKPLRQIHLPFWI